MAFQRFIERLKEYFTFTRKERNGIFILIILMMIMQGMVIYTHYLKPVSSNTSYKSFEMEMLAFEKTLNVKDTIAETNKEHVNYSEDKPGPSITKNIFLDPNKASAIQWKQFGIKDHTIHAISNYLAKGGTFRKKEDLRKIYTLKLEEYNKIEPYIKFETDSNKNKESTKVLVVQKQIIKPTELNNATMEELIKLPLIGEKRAQQIIRYRDLLGGFVKKEQLNEIYNFPDSVYQKILPLITVDETIVKHININADSISSLKHVYLKQPFARMIVNYRLQHGNYHSIDELRKLPLMTDSLFFKISQYLVAE